MITIFNNGVTKFFNIILYPFELIGNFWAILFLSILISIIILLAYKYLSSPMGIKKATNRVKAGILGVRIYRDFGRAIFSSLGTSLTNTLIYFSLNLIPLLVLIPFLLPMFVQMDIRYGLRSFHPGETIQLKIELDKDPSSLSILLKDNRHFSPVMNPVYINAFADEENKIPLRQVNWKLKAGLPGKTLIEIEVEGQTIQKELIIGPSHFPLSNQKFQHSSLTQLIYPVEDLIDKSSPITHIRIEYPDKSVHILGWQIHWLILHLVIVLILVLSLRKKFKVTFY